MTRGSTRTDDRRQAGLVAKLAANMARQPGETPGKDRWFTSPRLFTVRLPEIHGMPELTLLRALRGDQVGKVRGAGMKEGSPRLDRLGPRAAGYATDRLEKTGPGHAAWFGTRLRRMCARAREACFSRARVAQVVSGIRANVKGFLLSWFH